MAVTFTHHPTAEFAEHTEGPRTLELDEVGAYIRDAKGLVIAKAALEPDGRLYHAAPDLLKERDALLVALQELVDWQNGPPLYKYEKEWQTAYDNAVALLKPAGHPGEHSTAIVATPDTP